LGFSPCTPSLRIGKPPRPSATPPKLRRGMSRRGRRSGTAKAVPYRRPRLCWALAPAPLHFASANHPGLRPPLLNLGGECLVADAGAARLKPCPDTKPYPRHAQRGPLWLWSAAFPTVGNEPGPDSSADLLSRSAAFPSTRNQRGSTCSADHRFCGPRLFVNHHTMSESSAALNMPRCAPNEEPKTASAAVCATRPASVSSDSPPC
jgi:hypothetical protein